MGIPTKGVVMVAYGRKAMSEYGQARPSLRKNSDTPLMVFSDSELVAGDEAWLFDDQKSKGRWAKLNADIISPFEITCYVDVDVRLRGALVAGFQIIEDGWDMVLTMSARQGGDVFGHLEPRDREATIVETGLEVLQLQAGMIFFHRERCHEFFATWREEWARFRNLDQGAFARALQRVPLKIWVLGLPWNSAKGEVVEHRFGRAA